MRSLAPTTPCPTPFPTIGVRAIDLDGPESSSWSWYLELPDPAPTIVGATSEGDWTWYLNGPVEGTVGALFIDGPFVHSPSRGP